MPLSIAAINGAKPTQKTYSLPDGQGLSLEITPKGKKLWRFRYQLAGKRNRLSFGSYPQVSLKDARCKRSEMQILIAQNIDPATQKKEATERKKGKYAFEPIAREWYEKHEPDWAPRHAEMVIARLEKNVFPFIGTKSVDEINAQDVLAVIRRIEKRGALEVARRTRGICSQIFRYSIVIGKADRNPAADLQGALPPNRKSKHHASITEPKAVGGLMRTISSVTGHKVVCSALNLAPYVFVRPGELRFAAWADFDLEGYRWTIPPEKMKGNQTHIVPLSRQAVEILRDLYELTGSKRFVFPSVRTDARTMSENTVNATLRRLGYSKDEMTGHGFRSMASTLLNEHGWNRDAIERQLAHVEKNSVRAAYNHADYLPERKRMMQWWADYLDALRDGTLLPEVERYRTSARY